MNRINFIVMDRQYPQLEPIADKIADFVLKNNKHIFSMFCEFLRHSGAWRKNNYKEKLEHWKKFFLSLKGKVAPDMQNFVKLLDDFFDVCSNDDDIAIMRGKVPEKIIEKLFTQRYFGKICKMSCGSVVVIDGNEIKYNCSNPYDNSPEDSDKNKVTVDLGVWDGSFGEFVEVKCVPEGFHTKDIKYLRHLRSELSEATIEHDIYLITMGNEVFTRYRLEALFLFKSNEFLILGNETLFTLVA